MFELLNRPIQFGMGRGELLAWPRTARAYLLNLVPVWFLENHTQIDLYLDGDGFRVEIATNGRPPRRYDFATTELSTAESLLGEPAGTRRSERTVCLHLTEKQYLRKQILLPRLALKDLAAAASLQVDVETPFPERDVYVSVRAIRTTERLDPTPIELVVAPKRLVDELLQQLSASQIEVDSVLVQSSAGVLESHQLVRSRRGARPWRQLVLMGALVLCVASEILAAIYLPIHIRKGVADAMEAKRATMVNTAADVDAAVTKAMSELAVIRYARDAKTSEASVLEMLQALTSAIPDHTHINRFKVRQNQVELSGLTPSTSALVDELSRIKLLKSPTYMTPAARQSDGLERFNISLQREKQEAP